MHSFVIDSPVGKLAITTSEQAVHSIQFLAKDPTTPLIAPPSPFARETTAQLAAYFENPRHQFDLPLQLDVSLHHKKVLDQLQNIPLGQTKTYGEIAKEINSSPRAVGNACRHNPIALIIPCHRVIGANNKSGGFAGDTTGILIDIKKWLLGWELLNQVSTHHLVEPGAAEDGLKGNSL